MKTEESIKKNIEKVIMASDNILHMDWMSRLEAYIETYAEEQRKKALAMQAWWYRAFILFLAILFIGWYCIYGRVEKKIVVTENKYELCTDQMQ